MELPQFEELVISKLMFVLVISGRLGDAKAGESSRSSDAKAGNFAAHFVTISNAATRALFAFA